MSSDAGLTITVHESLESLDPLRPEWDALLADYPYSTTFSTYEWLASWWRAFRGEDELLVLAFRDSTSALIGLAPFAITRHSHFSMPWRVLRLMGDGSHDSDNLDMPVRPGYEGRFAESLLHFLQTRRRSWHFAEFNTLPPESNSANAMWRLMEEKKWLAIEGRRPASAIPLPGTWEEFQRMLSSKEKGKVEYYTKRVQKKYDARFYKCTSESELPGCLEALYKLHQNRWQSVGQPGSFDSASRRQFYLEFGRLSLAQGRLEFWLLDLNGEPVAAQFGFRYGNTVSQLQEGFDRAYSTDSVGYVLRAYVIRELIAQGVRRYDFLGGAPGYKAKWGAKEGSYRDLKFARPFSAGAAYLGSQEYARRSKAWLRRKLPKQAWDTLHQINVGVKSNNRKRTESSEEAGQDTSAANDK